MTVSEYALKTGKSKQSIYKRIRKGTIKTVEEIVNGKKTLFVLLYDDSNKSREVEYNPTNQPNLNPTTVEDNPNSNPHTVEDNPNNQPTFNPNSTPLDTTSRILELLQRQLEEKDKQIERLQAENKEKDRQLQDQFERFSTLLLRSQELEAITHKLLGQGDSQEPTEPIQDSNAAPPQEQTAEDKPRKKKSWFARLFE